MIFIVQPDKLAIDPSHTVHLQGPPRAIYTFAPLGLQFLENTGALTKFAPGWVLIGVNFDPIQ